MTATIIDGKAISAEIREGLAKEIEELKSNGVRPGLAVVLVGDNPASAVYVRNKARDCEKLGMYSEVHRLPEDTTQAQLLELIEALNESRQIHGILVQLPLPPQISEKAVIEAIAVEKDVDGFHPINVGHLSIGEESLVPCTPAGVIEMIRRSGIEIAGKHAVIVGRSNIVGKPAAALLLQEHATVSICHSKTVPLESMTLQADILVVAAGRPKMIGRRHVKPGAVVIDVGINRMEDGKLAGDVDYEDVLETAGYITPVPGGVGPMTITMLLKNTVEAARRASRSAAAQA